MPGTKVSLRPTGLSSQDNLENHQHEEKQMTTAVKELRTQPLIGASSTCSASDSWDVIDWQKTEKQVWRLQMRIAKAVREGKPGKVKSLQWLLTHSFSAKLLAVRRVVLNQGGKTAGVDGIIWKKPEEKMQAVRSMQRRGYQPQPLRRVYIPKKSGSGEFRPLGIPAMADRAMQALYLLALEPVYEMLAEKNVYGFRLVRSTADAIEQCFTVLSRRYSAPWILEGDIKACFDRINHPWMLANIPMDKTMLGKWLAAGYIEKQVFYPTEEGTPQGGTISPTLMNLTLNGMEQAVMAAVTPRDKVHVVVYADDFIITGVSREVLEKKVKPVVKAFLNKIRGFIKSNQTAKTENLILHLNSMIRGWAYHFRHVAAKKTFAYIDNCIFRALLRWIKRRHPTKSAKWMTKKYFRRCGLKNWIFFARFQNKNGKTMMLDLFKATSVSIKRHIKIKGAASPYDPAFKDYFEKLYAIRKSSSQKMDVSEMLPIF
jgi:RNA-directed DNA polymerase